MESFDLLPQEPDVLPPRKRHNLKTIRMARDNIERLTPDGTGAA
jgi:hypothetical protein